MPHIRSAVAARGSFRQGGRAREQMLQSSPTYASHPSFSWEYYYFPEGQVSARDIRSSVGEEFEEKADLWPELNLAAVDMDADTFVFQDARDCFVDPLDLAWLKEHGVVSMYSLSFEQSDLPAARRLMAKVMASCGGRICSDTDDFEPSWGPEDLKS